MDTSRLDLWVVNQLWAKSRSPRRLMGDSSAAAKLLAPEVLEYVAADRLVVSRPLSLGTSAKDDEGESGENDDDTDDDDERDDDDVRYADVVASLASRRRSSKSLTFLTDVSRLCIVRLSLMELSRSLRPLRLLDGVETEACGRW